MSHGTMAVWRYAKEKRLTYVKENNLITLVSVSIIEYVLVFQES